MITIILLLLKQSPEVYFVDVIQDEVGCVFAASKNIKTVIEEDRAMKSSGTWVSYLLPLNTKLYLMPLFRLDIEDPHVLEIEAVETLASVDYQIGVDELTCMICSFPRRWFALVGVYFSPDFCLPVQDADVVESYLFLGASAKNN